MIKALAAGLASLLLLPLLALGFFGWGWWTYKRSEREIVRIMDQSFLSITSPGRERYLLESDETFEVPYLASKLSIDAQPSRIFDAQGRLIGEYSTEKGLYVSSPDDLPEYLKRALIASEDGNFLKHSGVNWRAIGRAMLTNIRQGRRAQGGSTITQQLAKMLFTTRKKTYGRKVFELFCSRKLEQKFTKDQILLMYFNFAYFGHGAFGVESASRYYFNKPARELELAEAAMLVGIIPNPRKYSPFENLELAQARHRTVLTRMAKLGFIPSSAVQRYSDDFWEKMGARARRPRVSFWKMTVNEAPYLVERVRRALQKDFSRERLMKGGLRIHTTFDLELQKSAESALSASLAELNRSTGTAPIEGALAALNPADGAILTLVGGGGFEFQNQLDRTESRRPMGSSVKPFVWAKAMDLGKLKPDDKILDEPLNFKINSKKRWQPKNYGNKTYGEVTAAFALHKSINTVAIKILQDVGLREFIPFVAAATGLPEEKFPRDLSLALGTADVSVVDLARAYAIFVNGARPIEPYFITKIEDRDGAVLRDETAGRNSAAAPLLKPETCATMLDVMRGVLGPDGSGHSAVVKTGFNIPAAGKTGTTNDYRDAWFAGVTADLAAAVWIGHDDMRLALGEGRAGGAIAAPAWMNFVKAAYRSRPTRPLRAQEAPGAVGAAPLPQ